MIKMNTNENPYPPSPAVMEAVAAIRSSNSAAIRIRWRTLSATLRSLFGVSRDQIICGNAWMTCST